MRNDLTTAAEVRAPSHDSTRTLQVGVYTAFTVSGAAGLIYESVWSRYLGLLVGHAAYAQILVLGIYLAGLALGAAIAAQRTDRIADPLRAYGLVELAVGVLGILFHAVFLGVSTLMYDGVLPQIASTPMRTVTLWLVAAVLILPQAILLGTTFPLMAAGVLRRLPQQPGGVLSRLYFTNSIGAAGGVLLAGFALLAWVGLPGSVQTAGALNLLVGLTALWLARAFPVGEVTTKPAPAAVDAPSPSQLPRLLLAAAFGTAVASFIYEIGWLRMLGLVLGGATHSFEIMLSAFILGLALGAFWVRRRSDRWTRPLFALGIVQWVMGFAALATLPLYAQMFDLTALLLDVLPRSESGYVWFSLSKYGVSLLIMLPSTFCAGMTLPLITRTLLVTGFGEKAVGEVYAVNTLGAITGAGVAGLILLPVLGLERMMVIGAGIDMFIGVALFAAAVQSETVRRPALAGASAVTLVVLLLVSIFGRIDQRLLASGVFRFGDIEEARRAEVTFYEDGRTATISVAKRGNLFSIATNGKADGSLPTSWLEACTQETPRGVLRIDAGTQILAPLIALAHASDPSNVVVVGHGTGISSHVLLGHPNAPDVITVEIEPEMIRGSAAFYPYNARVFDDRRSRFAIEDARTFFSATDERFDVILSEPSNPWVSGVSHLFTVEFYRHVIRSLTDDGVFVQWMQLYEINDDLVLTVLAALHQVFPSYTLFQTSSADLLIVASTSELRDPDWELVHAPAYAVDLCRVRPLMPIDMEVMRVADRRAFEALFEAPDAVNSDFHPVLDLGAERARFASRGAAGFRALGSVRFSVPAMLSGRALDVPASVTQSVTDVPRAVALAQSSGIRAAARWWTPEGLEDGTDGQPSTVLQTGLAASGDFAGIVARDAVWRTKLQSGSPPPDWQDWVEEFQIIEKERSAGSNGHVEEGFFQVVEAYLGLHDPPAMVSHVVQYHRALAALDFAAIASRADSVLEVDDHADWIQPTLLLETAVAAHWMLGDQGGARRVWERLSPSYDRAPTDVRRRIVQALAGGTR